MKILLLFVFAVSLIEIAKGLTCYNVFYDNKPCYKDPMNRNAFELIKCWKRNTVQEIEKCGNETPKCLSWILRLKDQSEIVWKACDSHSKNVCGKLKETIGKTLDENGWVALSQCQYCSTDMCNANIQIRLQNYGTNSSTATIEILVFLLFTLFLL